MQQIEEKNTMQPLAPTEPVGEPLTPLAPDTVKRAEDDDNPDAIFFRAVSEIPTQPLNHHFTPQWELARKIQWYCAFTLFLFLFSLIASVMLHLINQPVITVTLLPVHTSRQITSTLAIPTRTLAPVRLTMTLSAPTTGKGHQDATRATGSLTLYNGLFTPQTIPVGTVFTAADGVKVVTDEAVTIPAGNPPSYAEATIAAQAVNAGQTGNIPAGAIHTTLANGVLVNNQRAFSGGRDARDFQAVAQRDLDSVTAQVQQQLTQAMPQAFSLAPGEALQPTDCTTHLTADHGLGEEAQTVSVHASKTCAAMAYNQERLQQQAMAVFTATRPERQFERVGSVRTTILSVSPLLVRVSGSWESNLSQDDEQWFAQHIQGETPAQARAYLLSTGLVSRVTITQAQTLPDWYHIKFLILIGV